LKLIDPSALLEWLKYFPDVKLKVVTEEEISSAEQSQKDYLEQKRGSKGNDRDRDRKDDGMRLGESSRRQQGSESFRKDHRVTSSFSGEKILTQPPRVVDETGMNGRGKADGKKRTLFEP